MENIKFKWFTDPIFANTEASLTVGIVIGALLLIVLVALIVCRIVHVYRRNRSGDRAQLDNLEAFFEEQNT